MGAESLSFPLMLWKRDGRGELSTFQSMTEEMYSGIHWKRRVLEGEERFSLAEPHQARSKAPSILVKRAVAKRAGEN